MTKPRRVGEPVQVYLDDEERAQLERLARDLGTTKSDVLRQGLSALDLRIRDPEAHPALQIIGLAERERAAVRGDNVAQDHDRLLAEGEVAGWRRAARRARRRRGR